MKRFRKALLAAGCVLVLAAGAFYWLSRGLPGTNSLRKQLWTHYVPKGRSAWVPLWAISAKLQTAVVVWEDPFFYDHHGFSFDEMWAAFQQDVRTRSYDRGGSTITQQVAKNLFLTPEKTMRRKLREAILTRRLEQALSKDEILEVYLNIAEWGDGIEGAEAASRHYFHKPAADLTWAEAALLAGILPNPHRFNPATAPAQALRHRQRVLMKLLLDEDLTREEFREAITAPCCVWSGGPEADPSRGGKGAGRPMKPSASPSLCLLGRPRP